MKRLLSFIAILVFFAPAYAGSGPEISFSSNQHDFGDVISGEQLHYEFVFSNTGTEDLQVLRLSPS